MPLKIHAGDKFPDHTFTDENSNRITLDELLSKGPLFLSFYRGYW